jgi:ferredoxin like protein
VILKPSQRPEAARRKIEAIAVEFAACLECGTCLAIAAPGALQWHYPRGGMGISYREG